MSSLTYGMTHLAINVRDVGKTLQFYQHVFGMEVMYHEAKMIQLTTPGNHDVIVFEEKDGTVGQAGGIAHFGFRLKESGHITQILARLKDVNAEIVDEGEFVPGSPYVFFKDPDGYVVEVWYELV